MAFRHGYIDMNLTDEEYEANLVHYMKRSKISALRVYINSDTSKHGVRFVVKNGNKVRQSTCIAEYPAVCYLSYSSLNEWHGVYDITIRHDNSSKVTVNKVTRIKS